MPVELGIWRIGNAKSVHKVGMPESIIENFAMEFPEQIQKEVIQGEGREVRRFKDYGINCYTKGGVITSLTFVFRGGTFASYDGTTDKGIGMWSTVADVRRAYGPPEGDGKSPRGPERSKNGFQLSYQAPAPHYYWMYYSKLGMTFMFSDAELASVEVKQPSDAE